MKNRRLRVRFKCLNDEYSVIARLSVSRNMRTDQLPVEDVDAQAFFILADPLRVNMKVVLADFPLFIWREVP